MPSATAPALPAILGVSEIAERFHVTVQLAHKWTRSKRFPEPAYTLSAGPFWTDEAVTAWAKEHRPDLLK